MPDIRDFKNWSEISKGYYRYVTAANACYEIMTVQQGAKTGPDYYALYVAGDWRDQTGGSYFKRETIRYSDSLEMCLAAAAKDYIENQEKGYDPTVTKEDIETLEKFLSRPDTNHTLKPKEAKSLVRVVLDIYKTVKEKEE